MSKNDSVTDRKSGSAQVSPLLSAVSAGAPSSSELKKRADSLGISFLEEAPKTVDRSVLSLISKAAAERYSMAVYSEEGGVLHVAMTDPEDSDAFNLLRFLSEKEGKEIEAVLASREVVDELLEGYSTTDQALKDAISSMGSEGVDSGVSLVSGADADEKDARKGDEVLQDAPIARLVESVVKQAIESRASDIHVEPGEEEYRVRFRVDGLLKSSFVFPVSIGKAVVARIKILSNLKIDEKRKPQDGRFRAEHDGEDVDLRVSTLPVVGGEKVVMRVLEKKEHTVDFDKMGLWGRNGELMREKIMEPYGIILMTGPTGSGKSTTLYAFLQILNQGEECHSCC